MSDSDARELKERLAEAEAEKKKLEQEKERELRARVTTLEKGFAEIKEIIVATKASVRAYLFAATIVWGLIATAIGIAFKAWPGH